MHAAPLAPSRPFRPQPHCLLGGLFLSSMGHLLPHLNLAMWLSGWYDYYHPNFIARETEAQKG